VRVSSREPVCIAADGEVFLTRSAFFKIAPNAARFVIPARTPAYASNQNTEEV
jgi:hypothetical protein